MVVYYRAGNGCVTVETDRGVDRLIDWVATFFTILGTYMQSRGKHRWLVYSFVVCLVGNVLWGVFAYLHGIWSMIVTGVVFGTLNIVAFVNWFRKWRCERGDA